MMADGKRKKRIDALVVIMSVIAAVALLVTIVNFAVIRKNFDDYSRDIRPDSINTYSHHYAMIYGSDDSGMWRGIYESASEFAKDNDAFVELPGDNLIEDYSKYELMEMAVLAGVDGIIIEGDETDRLSQLITHAREKEIPVVTVMTDAPESMRNSYIGISSYDIGTEIGNQVNEICGKRTKKKSDIMVLIGEGEAQSPQNTMYLALMDRLSNGEQYNIDVRLINSSTPFMADEDIRDILIGLDRNPDIMVCLSDGITKSAYQGLVEYNKVRGIELMGIASSDEIFEAVEKGLVTCAISVDKEQMGVNSVKALLEYEETGYVSEYIMVDATLVNKENVGGMINDETIGSD